MTTSKPMPLRLYLIRHGETEWTISRQHTGRTDIPLTPQGEDEARELAPRIRDIPFAHVLTSPRERARRTCELLGLVTSRKSNLTWRNGTMAITKGAAPRIFARDDRPGISFGTAPRTVNRPLRFPIARTV